MHRRPLILTLCVASLLAHRLAGDSFDLKRLTPVPDDEPIPAGDFLRPALLQQPTINRAGTHIAAIVTAGEDRHLLLIYNIKTAKYDTLGGTGDYDISSAHWLGNSRVAYEVAAQKLFGIGLFAADINDVYNSYPLLQYYGSSIIGIPRSDQLSPLVWNRYDSLRGSGRDAGAAIVNSNQVTNAKGANILTANISAFGAIIEQSRDNNERHILDRYPIPEGGSTVSYLTDKDGNLAFAVTDSNAHLTLRRLTADRKWEPCPVDVDNVSLYGPGNEPGQLLARPKHEKGKPQPLEFIDSATGLAGDILVADKGYDFVGWAYRDPVSGAIIGAHADREGPHTIWFDETYRKFQDTLNRSFPGLVVQILDSDDARNLFLVATYSDRQPIRYSWVDFSKHTAGLFKDSAPWINPKRMLPENIIRFKTRDGFGLDAYLTLPAGTSKDHPAPLIVLPHGGPFVRDNWGFDGEAQFLASRGYAVLKPNYRASPGYQWMFPGKDRWDFVKMSHDVTDATRAMITSGLVDPARIAIMGGSFGGYLTLKGLVDEPGLYRCGIAISGVYDWEQLISDKKYDYTQFDSPEYGMLMRHLGDPRTETAKFDEIAPVRHVDKIRVPVFVSHGGQDYNVDIGQSTRLISELKKHDVPYESYIVGNEGHGMYYFANRVEQYTRIEAFLQKNMPATAP